ncbi:MAG: winged helix-turn-helix domain-containing protein [Sphingomicrobium sp.]
MRPPTHMFGSFVLDSVERTLTGDGRPVDLSGRYFDALVLLVANAGQLITKERFHGDVWRGAAVTDEALTQCIRSLRQALGDKATSPRFIATVPGHGYRFVAPVRAGDATHSTEAQEQAPAGRLETIGALAFGGATAGIFGGIAYTSAGLVRPGLGAWSTMLGFISLCLSLGFIGGLAIGLGMAFGTTPRRRVIGAMLGGLAVGFGAALVGRDLFTLLFGKAPATFTGAPEGGALGLAVGLAAWLAVHRKSNGAWSSALSAPLLGAVAGLGIALTGGQLLAASLVELSRSFPESPLRFAGLSPTMIAGATMIEAALFCTSCVGALNLARRLGLPQGILIRRS